MGKIHVLHTGKVCVAPDLPFGGDRCSLLRASGLLTRREDRLWLPVSCYLIEYDGRRVLVDCGWHREMSPNGVYDAAAQIRSLGSRMLYMTNQGVLPAGEAIDEQLAAMGLRGSDLDAVLLTHLDCDHANGLRAVKDAPRILVSRAELEFARKGGTNRIRYCPRWWEGVRLDAFDWNGTEGPAGHSYDVFGDGRLVMVNIPGHTDGLCAVKVRNEQGRYALLFSDGGYAARSWQEQITSGIAADKKAQKRSLEWIAAESLDPRCIVSLANHDSDVTPQIIEF